MVAKQMFISEPVQIIVTFNMGEGNFVHKNGLGEGLKKIKLRSMATWRLGNIYLFGIHPSLGV